LIDTATKLRKAIEQKNFAASSSILKQVLLSGKASKISEHFKETDIETSHNTLELRDHVLQFLGLWDLYFAIQVSSFNLLSIIQVNGSESDIGIATMNFIRGLVDRNDERLDQSGIDIGRLSKSQYAVILPQILTTRSEELEHCIIQVRDGISPKYCIANLMKTYYGKKIVTAALSEKQLDVAVGKSVFNKISESLSSAGLDVSSMLHIVTEKQWDDLLCKIKESHPSEIKSRELRLLNRVKLARAEIFLNSFRKQVAALDTILSAKTQICNDVLMLIAADRENAMRRRAINALGQSGNSVTMEFLSNLLNDRDDGTRTEAIRAYSILASESKWSGVQQKPSSPSRKTPLLDIAKINRVLNTLLAKNMPTDIIEDTLTAVASQGGKQACDILGRLLAKHQSQVRMAVVKASRLLELEDAARIIRIALNDEDPAIVSLAEKEIDTRWPDSVW